MDYTTDSRAQLLAMDVAIEGLLGLVLVGLFIAALWPIADNILNLSTSVPNYALWRPAANLVPMLCILGVILGAIYVLRRPSQPQQPMY